MNAPSANACESVTRRGHVEMFNLKGERKQRLIRVVAGANVSPVHHNNLSARLTNTSHSAFEYRDINVLLTAAR